MMRSRSAHALVGAPSWPLVLFALFGPFAGLAVMAGVSFSRNWQGLSDAIGATVALALVGVPLLLLGTTGVWVKPGQVSVVDLFVVTTVPAEFVAEVRWKDGFTVASRDGVAVGTIALGGSLIAVMTGDRRQRNVAVRLLDWLERQPAQTRPTGSHTRIRWRWTAALGAVLWLCASAILVLLPAVLLR